MNKQEEEENVLLLPKEQHPQEKYITLMIFWVGTIAFYIASLQGGSVDWIKENLTKLGRLLMLSVFCFFMFNVLFFRWISSSAHGGKGGWAPKVIQLFITLGTMSALYGIDTEETLQNHGAENMFVFLNVFVPLTLITLVVMGLVGWLSENSRKICCGFTCVILLGLLTWMTISLIIFTREWSKGLNETRVENVNGVCEFRSTNIPWMDLLPDGAQNFWSNSKSCSQLPRTYTAKAENGRVYVSGCPTTPKVYFFPRTQEWLWGDKTQSMFPVNSLGRGVWADVNSSAGVKIPAGSEAMWVECGKDQEKQMLFYAQPDESPAVSRIKSHNANHHRVDQSEVKPNILLVYLDAVSRRHFLRKLHKTTKWLEDKHNSTQWDVLQYFRYHSVGFNTEKNSRAMYCGANQDTPGFDQMANGNPTCPIWRPMKNSFDYRTVLVTDFCEDWSTMYLGTITSQFADHEMIAPFCHPDYYSTANPWGNFKGPYSILPRCLMGEYVHKHVFNYMESIVRTYNNSDKPYYMHAIFEEGHEGTSEVISTVDDDLYNFLDKMERDKHLENTIVVLISDHGLHTGINFAFTANGALEHKLPLMNIMIPSKFNKEARDKLRANEQKLVTGFEVHKTLLELTGFRADGSFKPVDVSKLVEPNSRFANFNSSISLFDDIPWRRSCTDAQIPDDTCVCDLPDYTAVSNNNAKSSSRFFQKNNS